MAASCGLPKSGPGKRQIYAGSVQKQGDAFIVSVNNRVTRATSIQPVLGFSDGFLNAGVVGSDIIRPGDTLGLAIWENVDDGLLAPEGANATDLSEVQVDGAGFIFVPYAGRIKAAGNTPEALRRVITGKLDTQTPDPQVIVRRVAGDGATVSLVGGVGQQGLIARKIWFEDLYSNPKFDIALRPGDRILVEEDSRAFTVLGATGSQNRIEFVTQTLSAIEAIAQVGGLNSNLADPTGVFVFRNEPAEIANSVLGRSDLQGSQRFAYVLDLTEPTGMFEARDFVVRDGDTPGYVLLIDQTRGDASIKYGGATADHFRKCSHSHKKNPQIAASYQTHPELQQATVMGILAQMMWVGSLAI
ncbi:Capsule polysaccharide export outer membrane protein CtrA [Nymphon striatum]|nr:Capsule polysaccharide export outer membrane protein CtrA [Nymphon striatum]